MTPLRAIPDSMDPAIVTQIDARLDGIRAGVTVPLAIESGSRAWGFASPDSDYDCRFLYVRPIDDYLSPWAKRDVIETPLDAVLDVNGWDIVKALPLLLKGNTVVIEWLMSPIRYAADPWFLGAMLEFAGAHVPIDRLERHYLHLGLRQWARHGRRDMAVPLKRIFYALRPAAALRWLRLHRGAGLPPMALATLMAECDPPAAMAGDVADMIAVKAVSRETGTARIPDAVARFIGAEYAIAINVGGRAAATMPDPARDAGQAAAERLFRAIVRRYDPGPVFPESRARPIG